MSTALAEQRVKNLALSIAARVVMPQLRAWKAEYDADVTHWYTRGDGRSPDWRTDLTPDGTDVYQYNAGGLGYRYPSCIHGRSLWVDHDIPCGDCETGFTLAEMALHRAYAFAHEFNRRCDVMGTAHKAGAPESIVRDLTDWAMSCLPVEYTRPPVRRNLP